MNQPAVDVIIIVYNGEKFIEEAIVSIQKQTFQDFNIVIADDGSTDATLKIVKDIRASDPRIKILELSHAGISATLNAAIRFSTADLIAFLDSDDLWHPEKLERQMSALERGNEDVCFTMMEEFESFNEDSSSTFKARIGPLKGFLKITFLGKRELFETYGMFDEELKVGDFVEWYSRVIRDGKTAIMLDEVLAYRRVHDHNTTASIKKTAFLDVLKSHLAEKRKTMEM